MDSAAKETRVVEPERDVGSGHNSSDQRIGMAPKGADITARLPAVEPLPLVSKDSPTAVEAQSGELVRDPDAQRDSSNRRIEMARDGSDSTARYRQWSRSSLGLPAVEPFLVVPKELPTAEEARSGEPARDPNVTRNSSNQSIGMGRQRSEASIHMVPCSSGLNDLSASDRPSIGKRTYRGVVMALVAALIGVTASSAWQSQGDKAVKLVRTYAPSLRWSLSEWQSRGAEAKRIVTILTSSLDWLLPVSTKSSIHINVAAKQTGLTPARQMPTHDAAPQQSAPLTLKPAATAASISPELGQQLEGMARDLTVMRHKLEQLAATQEQMTHSIVSLQTVQQDIRQKKSSPPLSQPAQLPSPRNTPRAVTPQLLARASILSDWWIPDRPHDGYVYVQGHGDVYRVVPGTPLPGLGPVERIDRQNGHWVVVTPKGIIVSGRAPLSDGEFGVFDPDRVNRDDDAD